MKQVTELIPITLYGAGNTGVMWPVRQLTLWSKVEQDWEFSTVGQTCAGVTELVKETVGTGFKWGDSCGGDVL